MTTAYPRSLQSTMASVSKRNTFGNGFTRTVRTTTMRRTVKGELCPYHEIAIYLSCLDHTIADSASGLRAL